MYQNHIYFYIFQHQFFLITIFRIFLSFSLNHPYLHFHASDNTNKIIHYLYNMFLISLHNEKIFNNPSR